MTPDLSPRSIGRLVDEAIAVYRGGFRTLAIPAALLLLPTGLFVGMAQAYYLQTIVNVAPRATDPFQYLASISGPYGIFALMASVRALVALYYFACVLAASPALLERRPVPVGAFLKGGAGRVLMMFAVSIVVGIVAGIASMFLLLPGIAAYVYFSMAQPVSALEGATPDRALSRSFSLVRGRFWRTCGFFLAIGIVVFSLESAITSLSSIQMIVSQVAGGSAGTPLPSFGWQVLGGVLQGLAQTLTLPLLYVAWLMYYLDLRARAEGMDLLMRAQALAKRA